MDEINECWIDACPLREESERNIYIASVYLITFLLKMGAGNVMISLTEVTDCLYYLIDARKSTRYLSLTNDRHPLVPLSHTQVPPESS